MNKENILSRINSILDTSSSETDSIYELFNGTLNLLILFHGENSQVVNFFITEFSKCKNQDSAYGGTNRISLIRSTVKSLKSDFEANLIGSLQGTITGEVLTDFLQLARVTLEENGDNAKNVAAVLSAALFEDTIRRLAIYNGIPRIEKLADVLTELKNKNILNGTQVGVAQSYLTFRNKSLHAEWDKVGRETVASVLAFSEQLLLKHFS